MFHDTVSLVYYIIGKCFAFSYDIIKPSGQDCTAAERNYIAGILRKQSAVGGESCRAGFFLMPGKYCMGKYFEFSHITESLGITVHRERYIEF